MQSSDGRPIYLDLIKIRLPMPGIISIMHRGFGLILSFSIPIFTYLFALSLQSEEGFNQALEYLDYKLFLPVYFVLIWGFIHHLFAGIRYLLIDIEIGVDLGGRRIIKKKMLVAALLVSIVISLAVLL